MQTMKLAGALLAATMLAGCGTMRGAMEAIDHKPREPYITSTLAIANEASSRVRNLGLALTFADLPNCTPDTSAGTVTCGNVRLTDTHYDLYLDRTILLIDTNCSAYLDSLATLGASNRWTRSQFNTVSNYIGVLMALAGQSAEAMGYLDAGSAFFNSSADNLEALVLISPTPHKLTPLVDSAQLVKRGDLARIRQSDNRLRWSETSRWIESYAALCTPRGMRILLDEAIDNSATAASPAGLSVAASDMAPEVRTVLMALTAFRSPSPVVLNTVEGPAELGALAWRIRSDDLAASQQQYVRTVLGAEIDDALSRALADTAQKAQLLALVSGPRRSAFSEFQRVEEARWAAQSAEEATRVARAEATAAKREAEADRRARTQAEARADALNNRVVELERQLAGQQPPTP